MVVGDFIVYGAENVCVISKREHIFKRKLRSNSFTPMPSGVGVNEVFAQLFSKKRVLLIQKATILDKFLKIYVQ